MTTIAFVMLTYRPDHPSGIEKSIGCLTAGLRSLGHTVWIIAGGPDQAGDDTEPGLLRLTSVQLPKPATNQDVMDAIADPGPVCREVHGLLAERGVEVAVWGAPTWGLGHLHPAPAGVRTALKVHNRIRPSAADTWKLALDAADVVLAASHFLIDSAAEQGWDTTKWSVVPNAVLLQPEPVGYQERERLRTHGPVRIVSRAIPEKGFAELLAAMPQEWNRPVELVLAAADFEHETGETHQALQAIQAQQRRRADQVRLLPALSWRQVPGYLGGGCATMISTLTPETFSNTTAEALSAGTPVVSFDLGYPPTLIGAAGRIVALDAGMTGLWDALADLLGDHDGYHAASTAAPARILAHTPDVAARTFVDAIACPPTAGIAGEGEACSD